MEIKKKPIGRVAPPAKMTKIDELKVKRAQESAGSRAKSMLRPVGTASKPKPLTPKTDSKISNHGLKYECMIQGPILVTAAHSTKLVRGIDSEESTRIHLREHWVSYLAIRLAYHLGNIHKERMKEESKVSKSSISSFFIWSKSKPYNKKDVDPNYVTRDMYPNSHFHQGLRKWISSLSSSDVPFHIDIHGKINRKDNRTIDVGIESMKYEWPYSDKDNEFANELDVMTQEYINNAFEGVIVDGFPVDATSDCYLSGYWGEDLHTMTTQAIILGVPSFQLEIPRSVRKLLSLNDTLLEKFATNIYNLYIDVVCRIWNAKELVLNRTPYKYDTIENSYAKLSLNDVDTLSNEYLKFEKTAKDKTI